MLEEDKHVDTNINSDNKSKSNVPIKSGKNFFRKIVDVPLNIIKSNVKDAISKANPFDKNINKNDVSDSGVEGVRLAYTSSKKAVKTVDRTIKTTHHTIKTTKDVINRTGKVIYKTGKFTKKAVIVTMKVTKTVVVHVVASLMNPLVIIIIAFGIILLMISAMIVLLMGGGVSASRSINNAYSSAAGLVDISEQYQNAVDYFHTAVLNRQTDFNSIIDNLYYDYDNLPESSLVYMERTRPAPAIIYDKSFSVNERKETLKSACDMSLTITSKEAIAIAYVYLEKEKNTANHTEGGIYEVTYTQEVFDLILTKCVTYSDAVYSGQYCPDENCTKHVEMLDNPDYATAVTNTDTSWNAYDEWIGIAEKIASGWDWENEISWRVSNWVSVYGLTPYYSNDGYDFADYLYGRYSDFWNIQVSTPQQIEQVTYICEHRHDLHSIGLAFFTKEDIMNALEFTDNDKKWEELTEKGFENNPDISA